MLQKYLLRVIIALNVGEFIMRCPVCYNKIKYGGTTCKVCDFRLYQLNTATNKGIYKLRSMGEGDKVIYTNQIPNDVNMKVVKKRAILGGLIGLHNFYVGKNAKGIFNVVSMLFVLIMSIIVTNSVNTGAQLGETEMYLMLVSGIAGAFNFTYYIVDIVLLYSKKFKVPVAIKEDLKDK